MPFRDYSGFNPETLRVMTASYDATVAKLNLKSVDPRTGKIAAKIAADGGKVVATKVFSASTPVTGLAPEPAYEALNAAFGKVATELVVWAMGAM